MQVSASHSKPFSVKPQRRFRPLIYTPLTPAPPPNTGLDDSKLPQIKDFKSEILSLAGSKTKLSFHVDDDRGVLPIAEIIGDPLGTRSAKVAHALGIDPVLPTDLRVDEHKLFSLNALGVFSQRDDFDDPFIPLISLSFKAICALDRSPGEVDAWAIGHELRHRHFARLRAMKVQTPYDGSIDSRLKGPYIGHASFEELYLMARDAQKAARYLVIEGWKGERDEAAIRLESSTYHGLSIAKRLLQCSKALREFVRDCPTHIWEFDNYRGVPSLFFSTEEILHTGESDQTNLTIPTFFAAVRDKPASERSVVQSALKNFSSFCQGYVDYFGRARNAKCVEDLYRSDLLYPREGYMHKAHRSKMQRLYGFNR